LVFYHLLSFIPVSTLYQNDITITRDIITKAIPKYCDICILCISINGDTLYLTDNTNTELTAKIRELKELKIMAEELTAEITNIEDVIKAHMTATDTDTITADIFKVTWKAVTSNRFDSA